MRVTIIKNDGVVTVDGISFGEIDMSSLAENFHALQWYGAVGDLELNDSNTRQHSNVEVTSLDDFAAILDQWNAKKAEADAAALVVDPTPGPIVPYSITRGQCAAKLLDLGMITETEAIDMARSGIPPASVQTYISALGTQAEKVRATIDFAATEYRRDNPILDALMKANGNTDEEIDQFFISAAL